MKSLLIIFTCLLYVMQAFVLSSVVVLCNTTVATEIVEFLFVFGLIIGLVAFNVAIANMIVAIVRSLKEKENPYKFVMIIKLVQIPFYVVNFFICFLALGITANPFLLGTWIFIIPLSITLTYAVTLATSLYSVCNMIRAVVTKKSRLSQLLAHIILHFFFVADVISSVILFIQENRKNKSC